ncbi:hypothetical protein L596_008892 [Steinernema carpocapsae]|uniref:BTB domain-containing protein n=1 Tax=Steinernema carpocapsae TaxID=34508 RepID=A0A4U5PE15_STECR|nr:hypothetical protein L596_008892 [Steinernema carpocapsae]
MIRTDLPLPSSPASLLAQLPLSVRNALYSLPSVTPSDPASFPASLLLFHTLPWNMSSASPTVIRLSVDTRDADGGIGQGELKIGELLWKAECKRNTLSNQYELFLEVQAEPLALWSCEVAVRTVIRSPTNAANDQDCHQYHLYTYNNTFHRKWAAVRYEMLDSIDISPETRSLNVEVEFSVGKSWYEDLSKPSEINDTALIFSGGAKIFVSKAVLAMHSPFFCTLFDDKKDSYPIEGMETDDFFTVLGLIYPTALPIDVQEWDKMLAIGERFEINAIFNAFSIFICKTDALDPETLIKADHYSLIQDVDRIVSRMSPEKIRDLLLRGHLTVKISDRLKVMLLGRLARADVEPSSNRSYGTYPQYDPMVAYFDPATSHAPNSAGPSTSASSNGYFPVPKRARRSKKASGPSSS